MATKVAGWTFPKPFKRGVVIVHRFAFAPKGDGVAAEPALVMGEVDVNGVLGEGGVEFRRSQRNELRLCYEMGLVDGLGRDEEALWRRDGAVGVHAVRRSRVTRLGGLVCLCACAAPSMVWAQGEGEAGERAVELEEDPRGALEADQIRRVVASRRASRGSSRRWYFLRREEWAVVMTYSWNIGVH